MSEPEKQKPVQVIPPHSRLQQLSRYERPVGAVYVPKQEVLKRQWQLIKEWKPRSQIWSFYEGLGVLGATTVLTGTMTTMYLRGKLRLFTAGRGLSYFVTIPVPTMMTMFMQHNYVSHDILMKETKCPSCLEIRAASFQFCLGFLQPFTLSLFSSAALAINRMSFYIPNVTRPVELLKTFQGILKPFHATSMSLVALNLVTAVAVTHFQMKQVDIVHERLGSIDFSSTSDT